MVLFYGVSLLAQQVNTVAGFPLVAGSMDGDRSVATFNNPHGIAVDSLGNIYTCDRWSHIVRKITPDGIVSTIAGSPGITGSTDAAGADARFNEPWGICVGTDGHIYVADTRNNKIRKVTPEGVVTTLAGSGIFGGTDGFGTAASFGNPTGIEMDDQGNLYVADHLTHVIRKVDPLGFVSTIAGSPYQVGDRDGPGIAARFNRPYGLSLDRNGDILVADEWNHKIKKITPEGVVTTIAGNGTVGHNDGNIDFATFNYPWDITVDIAGNIYVADGYNQIIRKINTTGQVMTLAGIVEVTGATDGPAMTATFSGATGIAFSSFSNKIYIADAYNNLVREIINFDNNDPNNPQHIFLSLLNAGNIICLGEFVAIEASPAVFDTYHFYQNDQLVQSGTSTLYETPIEEIGSYFFEVVGIKDTIGVLSGEINLEVVEGSTPEIEVLGDTLLSAGDSVQLLASEGSAYFWSTGEETQMITITEPGSYTVEVTNPNGCIGTSAPVEITFIVEVQPVVISIDGPTTLCADESTWLSSHFLGDIQWYKDDVLLSGETDSILQVTTSGRYKAAPAAQDQRTLFSNEITIDVLPPLEFDFNVNQTIGTTDDVFQFSCTNESLENLRWDFGDTDSDSNLSSLLAPSHQFSTTGFYSVRLIAESPEGCTDTLAKSNYILVETLGGGNGAGSGSGQAIDPEGGNVFVPTAFTPNGDGINDVLNVFGVLNSGYDFKVFNGWGYLIFESSSPLYGWDGTVNGVKAENGNYLYLLCYENAAGEQNVKSGYTILIR